ncbi:hypothetical protein DK419_16045 [Methylobacterium terrae]|uniref:Uncharacterized protein n=1 Tax=Methylobacterium terrae TaxID=2202827 RepID=A0A2U8WNI0_9HYPH|nr:hypothetical protein [Methylobacterium terrae]AWN47637.1 hypothetical protein DK419_16045 [Methylobacterium terrae]
MTDNRLARAVPFDMLAPDHVIRFKTADLVLIEAEFGKDWRKKIELALNDLEPQVLRRLVEIGAKGPGGFVPPTGVDLDDLPFALADAIGPIADGLTCAITGKSHAAVLADREKLQAQLQAMSDGAE